VDAIESTPVLSRALEEMRYSSLKTFAGVGEPLNYLRRGGVLKIEVEKKSDVITVSMLSRYPEEAATIANGIVEAYMTVQALQRRATGTQMVNVIQSEKQQLQRKREECVTSMMTYKQKAGVMSFGTDRGNTMTERTATLSSSLTAAEIATMDIKAQRDGLKSAMSSPAAMSALVEAMQFKGKDVGDHEYDELRSQLVQHKLALSQSITLQGPENKRIQMLQAIIVSLKARIAEKEKTVAEAQLVATDSQLAAAEEKERQLRAALQMQNEAALGSSPDAAECLRLESEITRIQKQLDMMDERISEVSVNSIASVPLNIQVLENATADDRPVKPSKTLILAAALTAGWVLGIGAALLREWQDACLRTPEEIMSILGLPVLAAVPRINGRLSPVARGQLVHLDARSPVAEAYRSVRTALHLGAAREARTILLASPTPGDGKSTTASNLAIAFAQAGHRTLLIDCDLREPVQHMIFETDNNIGLSSVVAGEEKLRDAISPTRVPGLYVLPCGPVPANPSELLAGKRFGELMQALVETFDRVVIDSPPLMTVTDARILAASADATILVLRMNQSMRKFGLMAVDGLEKVGANVLGAVANDVAATRGYGYYGGSWQYAASAKRLTAASQRSLANGPRSAVRETEQELVTIAEPNWTAEASKVG